MTGAKKAVRKAESVGRDLCNFPEDAIGIEPDVARSRFLERIGASHCEDDNWQSTELDLASEISEPLGLSASVRGRFRAT